MKIGQVTREKEEIQEALKVAKDIMEALEIDNEEREELELERKREQQQYIVTIESDDKDLVEDIATGELHPTKVAKILEIVAGKDTNCKKCDKTISANESMTNHMRSHTRAEKTKIKCDKCEFETHDGDILLNHISETHIRIEKCLTCGETFVTKEDFVAHAFKEHAKNNNGTNKCAMCGEVLESVDKLIHHILRVHHLVNEQTLITTEAGHQLEKVWPNEESAKFKCYDCGKDVGERSNIIKHKREAHYKQKNCTSYHQHNYCRFSARDCVYIHRPEERQWQQVQQGQEVQGHRQGGEVAVCSNGPSCSWLANNRCRFSHQTVINVSAPARNVTTAPEQSTASISTLEGCMKAIMDRLDQLEQRIPPIVKDVGFPLVEGNKKSQ